MASAPATPARRRSSFTLIELLLVLMILGILSALVVVAVRDMGNKAQRSACQADAQTIFTAIETYRASSGHTAEDDPTMTDLVTQHELVRPSLEYPVISYTDHVPSLPKSRHCPSAVDS